MINSADLRLNNLVLDTERGELCTVIGIESDRVQLKPSPCIWTACDKIEGVKINENWLNNYGFRKLSYGDSLIDKICATRYGKKNYELTQTSKGYRFDGYKGKSKLLTYLHELQNNYKEVEGTELKMTK
jgi:hypothetical protein